MEVEERRMREKWRMMRTGELRDREDKKWNGSGTVLDFLDRQGIIRMTDRLTAATVITYFH